MFYENISEKNMLKSLESSFMGNKLGVQYNLKNKERKMKLSFGDMEATTRITKSRDY